MPNLYLNDEQLKLLHNHWQFVLDTHREGLCENINDEEIFLGMTKELMELSKINGKIESKLKKD